MAILALMEDHNEDTEKREDDKIEDAKPSKNPEEVSNCQESINLEQLHEEKGDKSEEINQDEVISQADDIKVNKLNVETEGKNEYSNNEGTDLINKEQANNQEGEKSNSEEINETSIPEIKFKTPNHQLQSDIDKANQLEEPDISFLQKLTSKETLDRVIKTQERVLLETNRSKEIIKCANEVGKEQLETFRKNSLKYGKYLKMIQTELFQVSDLIKKINIEIDNKVKHTNS